LAGIHSLGQSRALIVGKEKDFIPADRAAQRASVLVLVKSAASGRKIVAGIQICVPQEFEQIGFSIPQTPQEYLVQDLEVWEKGCFPHLKEPVPLVAFCCQWLRRNTPAAPKRPVLAQGDTGPGQFLFKEGRITAVIDWELSTLGHPLVDLAYYCMRYHLSAAEFRGLGAIDVKAYMIPTEAECVAEYCRLRGIASVSPQDWTYYSAFCMFRMAGILQGVLARALQGNASSATALQAGRRARPLAELGWKLVQQSFDV